MSKNFPSFQVENKKEEEKELEKKLDNLTDKLLGALQTGSQTTEDGQEKSDLGRRAGHKLSPSFNVILSKLSKVLYV